MNVSSLCSKHFHEVWDQSKESKTLKIPFLWLSLLPNPTEMLATQASMCQSLTTQPDWIFFFFSGIALFVMNRPEAKNAISKNFLRMVRIFSNYYMWNYHHFPLYFGQLFDILLCALINDSVVWILEEEPLTYCQVIQISKMDKRKQNGEFLCH